MKPGVSLIKRLRYRRWSIAAIIPLSLLVLELYEHRPEGLASLRPEFLAEILIGLILLLMVGVPLTKIAPTSVASIKTRLQPTSRSKKYPVNGKKES